MDIKEDRATEDTKDESRKGKQNAASFFSSSEIYVHPNIFRAKQKQEAESKGACKTQDTEENVIMLKLSPYSRRLRLEGRDMTDSDSVGEELESLAFLIVRELDTSRNSLSSDPKEYRRNGLSPQKSKSSRKLRSRELSSKSSIEGSDCETGGQKLSPQRLEKESPRTSPAEKRLRRRTTSRTSSSYFFFTGSPGSR